MPMTFSISDRNRVRANNHAARRQGSVTDAIRRWHSQQGAKPFHLNELRMWLRSQRCVWMSASNVEQKILMRLHRNGECRLDMEITSTRQELYRFEVKSCS